MVYRLQMVEQARESYNLRRPCAVEGQNRSGMMFSNRRHGHMMVTSINFKVRPERIPARSTTHPNTVAKFRRRLSWSVWVLTVTSRIPVPCDLGMSADLAPWNPELRMAGGSFIDQESMRSKTSSAWLTAGE